jgi:hypothetical protein
MAPNLKEIRGHSSKSANLSLPLSSTKVHGMTFMRQYVWHSTGRDVNRCNAIDEK